MEGEKHMRIKDSITKIQLPEQYSKNGKECFLDPYRKRLIEITPEEIVRQKIAVYCERILKVPTEMILLEVPMSHYLQGARGRADIIIHTPMDNNMIRALAVVECKKEDVVLSDKVVEQVMNYADIVGANYFIVTNGIDIKMAKYDEEKDMYIYLTELLNYEEMLDNKGIPIPSGKKLVRFTISELQDYRKLSEYNEMGPWIYGEDTPKKLQPFIVNLYQSLLDTEHRLNLIRFKNFAVVKDLGVRYMDYSNAGAGHFIGDYRSFLIEDSHGDSQILSFSIFGTGTATPLDKPGIKRKSYSTLICAIDKFKVSKIIMEYNLDKYLLMGDEVKFQHDGRISSLPSEELRRYVLDHADLINGCNGILEFGRLPKDEVLYLDAERENKLMYAFIEYALLREKYRNFKKKSGKR